MVSIDVFLIAQSVNDGFEVPGLREDGHLGGLPVRAAEVGPSAEVIAVDGIAHGRERLGVGFPELMGAAESVGDHHDRGFLHAFRTVEDAEDAVGAILEPQFICGIAAARAAGIAPAGGQDDGKGQQ